MGWFDFINEKGLFKPEHNPGPVKVKEGYQMPHWGALDFLEKLSLQIKEGKETELTDELLGIIKEVSEHPKDNYRTWYRIIKILSNLPNDKITPEILKFIPVWFSGMFDTMLQTSEVCEHLLPKFLSDDPTPQDIEKAELILTHLFSVERKQETDQAWGTITTNYVSRVYLYYLHHFFENNTLVGKLARHCTNDFILNIANTVKILLFNYPTRINEEVDENGIRYNVNLTIDQDTITITSSIVGKHDLTSSVIENYEVLNDEELESKVVTLLKDEHGISYAPENTSTNVIRRLLFIINVDASSGFGYDPISKIGDTSYSDHSPLNVFTFAFRNLLNEKVKQSEDATLTLLWALICEPRYKLSFFKRTVLYVIGENWEKTRSLFIDLIKKDDPFLFFSRYRYRQEIYELLNKNQELFSSAEKNILQDIFNLGKQDENDPQNEREQDDWKLYWYSALRNIPPFTEKYNELSDKLKKTYEHYENIGKVTFRRGHVSPVTIEDLLQRSNEDIVHLLLSFNPVNRAFDEPDVNGLADTLHGAVTSEPQFFLEEIEQYKNVPYLYAYQITNAFCEALKKNITLDWRKLLEYYCSYVNDEQFLSGRLALSNDSWKTNREWVIGAVAMLLSNGMNDDDSGIEPALLPLVKKLILLLAENISGENQKVEQSDYVNYTLNSTTGKVLRAVIDYALFRVRVYSESESSERMEADIISLFSDFLEQKSLEAFVLLGWHFEQFYFLDTEWTVRQVEDTFGQDGREWKAFMGGFAFSNPPRSKELYSLFYRHYVQVIDSNINSISSNHFAFINHFTAFYFWDFEQFSEDGLLYKFIETVEAQRVGSLIDFVVRQDDYYKSLEESERHQFEERIYELWHFLVEKYQHSADEQERANLAKLAGLLVYMPVLTEEITKLLLVSIKYLTYRFGLNELLHDIASIKDNGNPTKVSALVAQILSTLEFSEFMPENDQQIIREMVIFLFENGQHETASSICNAFASRQSFFLKDIYNSYRMHRN